MEAPTEGAFRDPSHSNREIQNKHLSKIILLLGERLFLWLHSLLFFGGEGSFMITPGGAQGTIYSANNQTSVRHMKGKHLTPCTISQNSALFFKANYWFFLSQASPPLGSSISLILSLQRDPVDKHLFSIREVFVQKRN